MSQNAQSIQTLLDAEKDAAKIVTKARQYRVQRLKDARSEAAKDIDTLKAQRHAEFVAEENRHQTAASDTASIDAATQKEVSGLKGVYAANQQAAINAVVAAIANVHVESHPNALLHKQKVQSK